MLKLKRPLGSTALLTIFWLILLLAGLELLARHRFFHDRLLSPRLGTTHHQFELQADRLAMVARERGHVDCIFLGNSMVWRGFDTEAFTQAYREATGEELFCFNFGVAALPAAAAGLIAPWLVETYQPRLLIFGTDARDYAVPTEDEDAKVLLDMAWLQYQAGDWSFEGWLYEYSYLYRYRLHWQQILKVDHEVVRNQAQFWGGARYGFDADDKVGDVKSPPDPHKDDYQIQYYYRLLSHYQMLDHNLVGLDQLLGVANDKTTVLVVEMPIPATHITFFGHGEADHQRFVMTVKEMAAQYNVPFWPTTPLAIIPDDGWVDYSHLNTTGAAAFSAWLGERLGEAVETHAVVLGTAR